MATTAPTVTGYSPFWSNVNTIPNGSEADYNSVTRSGRASHEYNIALAMSRPGFRGVRRTIRALLGASAGAADTETYSRVTAQTPFAPETLSGLRPIETATVQSGVTTAADVTYINAQIVDRLFNLSPALASYPADASGNGGGGKGGR